MIKTLSSYYLTIPLVSPLTGLTAESVELKLYVWNGDKTAPPITETYKLTEPNPEALTNSIEVNIARLINDFIDFEPQVLATNLQDGNNQVWVKSELYYNTEDAGESAIPQSELIQLALKGYGFALEGVNPQTPADKLLLTNREFKVARNSKFIVPVIAEEADPPPPLYGIVITNITLISGQEYSVEFTFAGSYDSFVLFTTNGTDNELSDNFLPSSPQTLTITVSAPFDSYIIAQETTSGQFVQSNTFNFI